MAAQKLLVLIVEDDDSLRKAFLRSLAGAGYNAVGVRTVEEALSLVAERIPDLVLSDIRLRGKSGFALCRELRSNPSTSRIPIVLVSGYHQEEDDQVEGLDSGADDYLLKPVSQRILLAKIQSVLRRYKLPGDLAQRLKSQGLTLDVRARIATHNGRPVSLTRKEFDLLVTFLQEPGVVFSHEDLLERVWGVEPGTELDTRTVTVHVSSLRLKLGRPLADRIWNVPRMGYRFDS